MAISRRRPNGEQLVCHSDQGSQFVALAFGLVTPPYGLCLMISCAIAKVRLRYALKDTMIMLAHMLAVLAALIIWPQIPLFLPELIRPDFLK
jgi:TRAP-type C4-dicarboxylate transport system permease large subunit